MYDSILLTVGRKEIDLARDLFIEQTESGVNEALCKQASLYAWWAVKLARAKKEVMDQEERIDFLKKAKKNVQGHIDIKLRTDMKYRERFGLGELGQGKLTETAISSAIEGSKVTKRFNKIISDAYKELNERKFNESILWGAVEAFRQRSQALGSLSFSLSEERRQSNVESLGVERVRGEKEGIEYIESD